MRIVQLTTDSREHFKDYGALRPYFGAAPEALLSGLDLLPDLEIHVVSCVRAPVSNPEKIGERTYFHALEVPKLGWLTTGYQGCIRAVRSLVADLKPDIVHGQGTERDCAMSAVYSGFPNVVTIHGNMLELQRLGLVNHPVFGHLAGFLETHALRRTAGVFCNSSYTRSLVAPRSRRTWLVPNSIRPRFLTAPVSGKPEEVPQVVNVGLSGPRKRQLEILRTVREVVRNGHPMRIVFAGGLSEAGEYDRTFSEELRAAEKEGIALHVGFLEEAELIALLDRSHGFIHFPSEEAFGLVVAEAMARGLKFFGSDLGGIRDISEGVPGAELHESFEGLKNGLTAWLREGAPRHPEAAASIANRYSPAVVARRHVEIYREVLGR